MTLRWRPPAHAVARVRAEAERSLSPTEFGRWVGEPMTAAEREEALSLIAWFQRRYRTPAERLAYSNRAAAYLRSVVLLSSR